MKSAAGTAAAEFFCNVVTDNHMQLNVYELFFDDFTCGINIRVCQKFFWGGDNSRLNGREKSGSNMSFVSGLCSRFSSGFLPVGLRLLGIFFLKGRAEDGSEEFSKLVFSLFSSFLFV